ncbi:3-oxo-5-alpha-steroid 4-dehydrogenase-domain-containing protein [Cokeromyces recurvatus]|uniref:3-oxo-5-alpha-steroid 4-dehydrogenase-domain-containing protein n=1 Tax=Cokeromyces recurvatus TaxID=90255 RepID=UPI00221F3E04|nr:3-oxo-5-alpha-steroid 4-dehydrogenase-domain-containing protein [Cokeromyces recurvatus]KAI7900255.1 3-oxo-5-alpha-steroid 4-dehydrogenase-domain-containing protein [Cokeromyces recurvatus]
MYIPEWNLINLLIAAGCIFGSSALIYREFFPSTRLQYSKFSDISLDISIPFNIPSFFGMLLIYTPSLILSIGFLWVSLYSNFHMILISFLTFLHYLKRVLEVLFIHKYSGKSNLFHNILISLSYATFAILIYFLSIQTIQYNLILTILGVILFFTGEAINFYHHCILRDLRKDGSKGYKIPHRGLFKYIWCPHYVGEIISFIAFAFITQHFFILILQLGSTGYLTIRAYNTKQWYKQKFNKIPKRACLLPYIF